MFRDVIIEMRQLTLEHTEGVLTVRLGRETTLLKANELAARMKRNGLIADWQQLVVAKSLNIILKLDTSPRRRKTIVDEFTAAGYEVSDAL